MHQDSSHPQACSFPPLQAKTEGSKLFKSEDGRNEPQQPINCINRSGGSGFHMVAFGVTCRARSRGALDPRSKKGSKDGGTSGSIHSLGYQQRQAPEQVEQHSGGRLLLCWLPPVSSSPRRLHSAMLPSLVVCARPALASHLRQTSHPSPGAVGSLYANAPSTALSIVLLARAPDQVM